MHSKRINVLRVRDDMDSKEEGSAEGMETPGSFVGRFVKKDFGDHGVFAGKVVSYNTALGYYKVCYEDGDREDLELHELREILVPPGEAEAELKKNKQEQMKRQNSQRNSKRDAHGRFAKRPKTAKAEDVSKAVGSSRGPEVKQESMGTEAGKPSVSKTFGDIEAAKPSVSEKFCDLEAVNPLVLETFGDIEAGKATAMEKVTEVGKAGEGDKIIEIGQQQDEGKTKEEHEIADKTTKEDNIVDAGKTTEADEIPGAGKVRVGGKIREMDKINEAEAGTVTEVDTIAEAGKVTEVVTIAEASKVTEGNTIAEAGKVTEDMNTEVEKTPEVKTSSMVGESESKPRRRGRKKKVPPEEGGEQQAKDWSDGSITASRQSKRRRRSKFSQDDAFETELDFIEAKESSVANGVLPVPSQPRGRGRPRKYGIGSGAGLRVSAQKDEVSRESQQCSSQKDLAFMTPEIKKKLPMMSASEIGWSDSGIRKDNPNPNLEDSSVIVGDEGISSDDDFSDCNDSAQVVPTINYPLSPMQPLPESSGDIPLPESSVPDLFSVYVFLRSFSDLLFLSPFSLEDFVGALHFRSANSLIDNIHVCLLRALRRHLETLFVEGNGNAKKCLRQLDWDFLDAVTWPVYLAIYLLTQGINGRFGKKIADLKILDDEYYKIMPSTKLSILQFLCDDVMEAEEFRTKVNMSINYEHDTDADWKMQPSSTPSGFEGRNSCFLKSKLTAYTKAVVQKSSHESTISISDNSLIQNRHGSSNNGQSEFTAMNDEDFNSDECRLCGMDGKLICCDGCPSAYHSRCVGISKAHIPSGSWYCPDCVVKKGNAVGLKAFETLSGAEIFGIDPYERVFFGTCGYLLVSDSASIPTVVCRYYNRSDVAKVLEVLDVSGPFYKGIKNAILQYWDIPDNLLDAAHFHCSDLISGNSQPELSYPSLSEHSLMHDEASRSGYPGVTIEGKTEKTHRVHEHEGFSDPNNAKEIKEAGLPSEGDKELFVTGLNNNKETELTNAQGASGTVPSSSMDKSAQNIDHGTVRAGGQMETLKSDSLHMQEHTELDGNEMTSAKVDVSKSNLLVKEKQTDTISKREVKINSSTNCFDSKYGFQSNAYVNHYALGDIAASAAAKLASMNADPNKLACTRGTPKRTAAATMQEQVKAFSEVSRQFYWPNYKKKAMEPPKERCEWCMSCKSATTCRRACLLNVAACNAMAGAANVVGGLRPTKNGDGHLPAVAAYIIYIEDCLHGLMVGSLESPVYRKHWRKCVEQASTTREIRTSLLELEQNIRLIALVPGWTKHIEDPLSLISSTHTSTNVVVPTSRRGGGARRHQKNSAPPVTVVAPNNSASFGTYWWRGGRLSNQVFQQGVLPRATAKRTGRQGGFNRIHGVSYVEGSDIPGKSRQYVWRAAVERAMSVSQLAVQVRYLDAHVKWEDLLTLEDHSEGVNKASGKEAVSLRIASVCDKKYEDGGVKYLLDFGNQKDIPISAIKHGGKIEETQEGKNRYWLGEFHVPLYLLKAFEERLLENRLNNGYTQVWKNQKKHVQTTRRKHTFSLMQEKCSCAHCGKDLLIRKAVQCGSCEGSFHPDCAVSSEVLNKSTRYFICDKCYILNVQSEKNVVPSLLDKQVEDKDLPLREKVEEHKVSYSQPFGANGAPQNRPGIDGNLAQRKKSNGSCNQYGLVWKKKKTDESGRDFRKNKLLLAYENNMAASDGPKCFLCYEAYNPKLMYIGCEFCEAWFHADAFELNQEKIGELNGFKCHRCRKKGGPACPYKKNDTQSRREKLPIRRQGVSGGQKMSGGQKQYFNKSDRKPFEARHSTSGLALNELWTNLDEGGKHVAIKSEPNMQDALHASVLNHNQEMHATVKSEPDLMFSPEASPLNINQSVADSNLLKHSESSSVGTENLSSQVAWDFSVTEWPSENQQIDFRDVTINSVEPYPENEPLFTLTELLACEHDQMDGLGDLSQGIMDNSAVGLPAGKETSMDSQSMGVENKEYLLSGAVMSSNTSDCQMNNGLLMGLQLHGAANSVISEETQFNQTDNTVSSTEEITGLCKVCGCTDLPPDYQCKVCGVAIHHHCYEWQQIGMWTASGWTCNSCLGSVDEGL